MNQLVPTISKFMHPYPNTGILTFTAPEDFVIRGLVEPNSREIAGYIGGSEAALDGNKAFEVAAQDYCYNFIPLEVPVTSGDKIKIQNKYAGKIYPSLLSDKAISLDRWKEYFVDGSRLAWQGGTPTIEDDPTYGKRGDFSGIANAAYTEAAHTNIIYTAKWWATNTPPNTDTFQVWVKLPAIRSTSDGNTRVEVVVYTRYYTPYQQNPRYQVRVELAKVVSGVRTVLSYTDIDLDPYWFPGYLLWNNVKVYTCGLGVAIEVEIFKRYFYVDTGSIGGSIVFNSNTSDCGVSSGSYIYIPTGNQVKLAVIDIY
ncbi:MAG: hypothetical protein PHV74_00130 [Dehalococcoidia bacterium]|nr:hypothetical protein [Dehalococcoidia bacterium]